MNFKKIICGLIIVVTVIFMGIDIYKNIQESRQPKLVFVEEKLRTSITDQINGYQYVVQALDYENNDILDTKHLKYESKMTDDKLVKLYYTLTDDEGHSVNKTLTITLVDSVEYTPSSVLKGAGKEKKEEKVFYLKDYNNNPLRTMSEADMYGNTSNQEYKIEQQLNKDGQLEGYKCVFIE